MNRLLTGTVQIVTVLFFFMGCKNENSPNQEMINLLSSLAEKENSGRNRFSPQAKLEEYQASLRRASDESQIVDLEYLEAQAFLELGNEEKAVEVSDALLKKMRPYDIKRKLVVMKNLATAWLRLGERTNCINSHSGESCVFPIAGSGIHLDKTGSEKAIEVYENILNFDPSDLESRWLLNIAYMTIGGYPQQVPPGLLIPGLDADTSGNVKPFFDAAIRMGLNTKNMAGGSIIDDFNNDGYLDLVTSAWGLNEGMHYSRNNSDGTFTDISDSSGLKSLTGGLNIMQTDYNNDGLKDIFVLRGAWKEEFGKHPNSLLRNNGDGTFTDVTKESGLLSFRPTQTATWTDFDCDGWLDVFIGNETVSASDLNPCELFINNKDGTFKEVAANAGCDIKAFVKGVTSGDYDNDGLPDIFISTMNGWKILLKNEGIKDHVIHFKDVSIKAGLHENKTSTFPTWFWDYDNDGWLDILVCGYDFNNSLAVNAAAEALNRAVDKSGSVFLFRNNRDGTFEDVSTKAGLNKIAFAMGSNFGDIDNDGYLDMYLGTGNPSYQSLVPNKMFRNVNGQSFADITTTARVGNLQKGHGVSFADFDNDGDQDIHIEMGGAYVGDAYQNSLYINPGQNNNHWINIKLTGVTSNRAAIGARIKVTFNENGVVRSVYRDVNSGGSFGSNPLSQHIGIGQATSIQSVEIKWPGSSTVQIFNDLKADEYITLREGDQSIAKVILNEVDFILGKTGLLSCAPVEKVRD